MCKEEDRLCNPVAWEAVFLTLNISSLLINTLHHVILSRIIALKGTNYLLILRFIAALDIAEALVSCVRVSCTFRPLFLDSRIFSTCFTVLSSVFTIRYYIMATACVERLTTIMYPMSYSTSCFASRIALWMALQIILLVIFNIIIDSVFFTDICMSTYYGPIDVSGFWPPKFILSLRVVASCVILIALIIMFLELNKMKKRSLTEQQRELVVATKTVMIISALLVACLIPPFIGLALLGVTKTRHDIFTPLGLVAFFVYGILNTIVYGWRNASYRKALIDTVKRVYSRQLVNSSGEAQQS